MDNHDSAYRLLFSHPEMIRDLLTGFVPEDWVGQLDMTTLEKVNGNYITDDLRSRSDDVVWRVRWGSSWVYVYILLEFQSTQDRFMAVRLMTYMGLLWQDLIRTGQLADNDQLPPVMPLVLYNGEQRWRAPVELSELIGLAPESLFVHLPSLRYLLIDEGAFSEAQLAPLKNLVAALFRLENSRGPADIQRVLGLLIDWLKTPEQSDLRRNITEWVRRVILPRRLPTGAQLPEMRDIQEVHNMLAERVQQWYDEAERKGLENGLRKGLEQGLEQGLVKGIEQGLVKGLEQGLEQGLGQGRRQEALAILTRQLNRRFGPLPQAVHNRLESADIEQLENWIDRILDATTLEDVFL